MTTDSNERNKRIGEKVKKSTSEYLSRKRAFLLVLFSIFICELALSHGFSESWAWKIAESIITIDGIIIGFTFIGIALFSPDKAYPESLVERVLTENLKDFLKQLKVVKLSDPKEFQRKLALILESSFDEISQIPASIVVSIQMLVVSIAFALTLFGVSDATANDTIASSVFTVTFFVSISALVLGIYLMYKFMQEFAIATFGIQATKALRKSLEIFEKGMQDMIAKNSEKDKG